MNDDDIKVREDGVVEVKLGHGRTRLIYPTKKSSDDWRPEVSTAAVTDEDRDAETAKKWTPGKKWHGAVPALACEKAEAAGWKHVTLPDGSRAPVFKSDADKRTYMREYGFRKLDPGEIPMNPSREAKMGAIREHMKKNMRAYFESGQSQFSRSFTEKLVNKLGL